MSAFKIVKQNIQHVLECPNCKAHVVVDYNGVDPVMDPTWGEPLEPGGNVYACPSCLEPSTLARKYQTQT